MVPVGEWLVNPSRLAFDAVVMATERGEIGGYGRPTFAVRRSVIDIAIGGRHPATREDAGGLVGLDLTLLIGGRPPAGDSVVDDPAGVWIGCLKPPLGLGLVVGYLAGDVGDDRPVAGQLAGVVGKPCQSVEIYVDVDNATLAVLARALEKVEEDVGPELIHRSLFTGVTQAAGDPVEPSHDGGDPMRREIETKQVAGPVGGGFRNDSTEGDRPPVPVGGVFGVDFDTDSTDAGCQLARGETGSVFDDLIDDLPGMGDGEMLGATGDGAGPAYVDIAGGEQLPDAGEPLAQVEGEGEFGIRGATGQSQRRPNLGGGGLGGELGVVVDLVQSL